MLDVTVLATAIPEAINTVKTVVIPMIGIEAGMATKEGTIPKEPPEDDTHIFNSISHYIFKSHQNKQVKTLQHSLSYSTQKITLQRLRVINLNSWNIYLEPPSL